MKKLSIILFILSSIVYSQTFNLHINKANGDTITIAVSDIQRIEFTNITGVEDYQELQQIIESFKLMQNYPNPFNPSTTIEYQIPKTSNIILSIFDVSGKLIKEILNETQAEGAYKVTWDGTNQSNTNVASGIYIYTIKCGEQLLSKRMILIR